VRDGWTVHRSDRSQPWTEIGNQTCGRGDDYGEGHPRYASLSVNAFQRLAVILPVLPEVPRLILTHLVRGWVGTSS